MVALNLLHCSSDMNQIAEAISIDVNAYLHASRVFYKNPAYEISETLGILLGIDRRDRGWVVLNRLVCVLELFADIVVLKNVYDAEEQDDIITFSRRLANQLCFGVAPPYRPLDPGLLVDA